MSKIRKMEASEGMTLTNGEAYGKVVYLGCNDTAENWHEIPDDEVPQDEPEVTE